MYAMVAAVEDYADFLPWCQKVRVHNRKETGFDADLVIGFKMFRERFTSRVALSEGRIEVEYIKGPLKYLHNHWGFVPLEGGGCTVDFMVDFEFQNRIFEKMIGAFFTEAVKHMIHAFEGRAKVLYG